MLEEIRKQLQEQKNNPNSTEKYKTYIEKAIAVFDNEDAISILGTSHIMAVVHSLGYSIPESEEIALKIEEEVNQKYHYVNPDRIKSK